MKLAKLLILHLFIALSSCSVQQPKITDFPAERQSPNFPNPPVPERTTLPNGLTLLVLPDNELPLVSGSLYMSGGSLWEDTAEQGVVGAMGAMMRAGGAASYSAAELDRKLEDLAASVGTGFGQEFGSASFVGLSSDFETIFKIFSDVVKHPRFEADRLEIWKGQMIEGIRRRGDDPNTIAGIAFRQLLFGEQSPYGRVLETRHVQDISREDLLKYYRRFVRPGGSILAVTGKVDPAHVKSLAAKYLGDWSGPQETLPSPFVPPDPQPAIYFIEKPFAQATVYMGELGAARLSPDHIDIGVFNTVFGASSFGSLLVRKVRTEEGLVYSIYGSILPSLAVGKNLIAFQTAGANTAEAIKSAVAVLADLQKAEPAKKDVTEAIRSDTNSFVFNFDRPSKVVMRRAELEMLGFPDDYDQLYVPETLAVTPEDIRSVSSRRWDISKLVIIVVGPPEALKSLGNGTFPWQSLEIQRMCFKEKLSKCP